MQVPNCFTKWLILSITIFSKVQFWQVLTRLKICLKWTPPLTFPAILKPAAYLGKDSTTNVYILKPKANCFSIKGLHHRQLVSEARDFTLNGISRILWTGTITKIFFSIMQHTCNKFFFHVSNSFKQSFVYKKRDDVHIHLATLISQQPIAGTRIKFESDKPWQKWIILVLYLSFFLKESRI